MKRRPKAYYRCPKNPTVLVEAVAKKAASYSAGSIARLAVVHDNLAMTHRRRQAKVFIS